MLDRSGESVTATRLDDDGTVLGADAVPDLAVFVAEQERESHPRWVWDDTRRWYPRLLHAGVRVDRCHDLRLCHAILRLSELAAGSELAAAPPGPWDAPAVGQTADDGLFAIDDAVAPDPLAEYSAQRAAVDGCGDPARLSRLLAAESVGALIAAELHHAGLPWSPEAHDRILTGILGPRPRIEGERPERMQQLLDEVRRLLDAPTLNPDSQSALLTALQHAGLRVASTSKWELQRLEHPAIPPLLEYKRLARLLSANGWQWLETWVQAGRFRPEYVPGGVVTGRWATSGGGALQLPKQIRGAVVADPGWKLVVADAAQLEPRILAAMAGDRGMVEAGAAGDLYAGIVASGAVADRQQAKIGMLGAMYGATSGEGGRVLPRLARAYPRAIALVEEAARTGERGGVVSTRLGRSSPPPGSDWARGLGEDATPVQSARARERARAWGRFTRNFVVQGTAAEWALCWMAGIRRRLRELSADAWLTDGPHLVFFLHDEVVVHTPDALAPDVADAVTAAAVEAGRLLFGALPVTFPLTMAVVDDYGQAK